MPCWRSTAPTPVTFGGVISGNGAFQQNGTGTTDLTAINGYTGATTVNGGDAAGGRLDCFVQPDYGE